MATRTSVVKICDRCKAEDTDREIRTLSIIIGRSADAAGSMNDRTAAGELCFGCAIALLHSVAFAAADPVGQMKGYFGKSLRVDE